MGRQSEEKPDKAGEIGASESLQEGQKGAKEHTFNELIQQAQFAFLLLIGHKFNQRSPYIRLISSFATSYTELIFPINHKTCAARSIEVPCRKVFEVYGHKAEENASFSMATR